MPKGPALGTIKVNEELSQYLKFFNFSVSTCVIKIIQEDNDRLMPLVPLLYSVVDSCESLVLLNKTKKGKYTKVRDSYIISRAILETIINVVFMLAEGEPAIKRARKHYLQKSYRDLERTLKIDDQMLRLRWSGLEELKVDDELKDALAEFTTKRNTEEKRWTKESIEERLRVIHKKFGTRVSVGLQFGLFGIYRHSSEILHGTFFGAMHFFGLTKPKESQERRGGTKGMLKRERTTIGYLLYLVILCNYSLVKVLGDELDAPVLYQEAKKVMNAISRKPWMEELRRQERKYEKHT